MTKDALLEIGCEELPASFVTIGIRQLKAVAEESLAAVRLSHGDVTAFGTPRRLAVCVSDLASHSEDQEKLVLGPPVAQAHDAQGQWTPAALGFARKHGLKPEGLSVQNERLCAIQKIEGTPARMLLSELFPQWVSRLEFPKSMVWEVSGFRFARPIRWLMALYGPEVVPFALAGVRSGRYTYGLSLPSSKKVPLPQPGKYAALLKNQCILVDPASRQEAIRRMAEQMVRKTHGRVILEASLLEQVANLVEHPVAILGDFDPGYLSLPREVLVTCLQHHQKFFPVEQDGEPPRLMPHFVGIRNGMSVHQDLVREGYERVLAARLADARFFYNHDRQTSLASKVEALKGVTFQKDLGTLFDKKERVKSLLEAIAGSFSSRPPWLPLALRAADLCKADLVTDMVREFPELQGTMARLYAGLDGEDLAVADALEQHYWPVPLTGPLPGSEVGAAVALADKLDTLAGDFAVGLIPSGSADPYGLRRSAVGVLRLLEDRPWRINVEKLLTQALGQIPGQPSSPDPNVLSKLRQFMKQRFAALLEERGFRFDEIEAVLESGLGEIPDVLARLRALHAVRSQEAFGPLSVAFKRGMNIYRQASKTDSNLLSTFDADAAINPDLFKEPCERALFEALEKARSEAGPHLQSRSYGEALLSMVILREPLDQFFDGVMVMAEDPALKSNRLALVRRLVQLFLQVADFSKLQNA